MLNFSFDTFFDHWKMRIQTKIASTWRAAIATMWNDMFHYLSKLLITLFLLVPINLDHQWLCNIRLNFLPTSKFLDCVYASNIQSIYIVSKPRYNLIFHIVLNKNKDTILYMHHKISSNVRSLFSRKIHNQFSVIKKYRGFV